jgi:hypothetical protein
MGNCDFPLTVTGPQIAFFREGAALARAGSAIQRIKPRNRPRAATRLPLGLGQGPVRAMRLHNTSTPRLAAAVLGTGLSLALPASAMAIDPGVNYDPGSPAGKEYAIPLVEGRSEGAGTTNQRAGANIPFGVGITPSGSGRGGGKNGGAEKNGSGTRAANGVPRDRSELESRLADAESVGGTAGRTVGIAIAVLLAAALAAVALRRRQGPQAA